VMNLSFPQPGTQFLPASDGETPAPSRERWPALDGLRGLALLAVMALHTGLAPGGFLGVDLFFVLSGFLITFLLVRERQKYGSIGLGHFYMRRMLRLCPALWAMLLVLGLATLTFGTRHDLDLLRRTLPSVLLYIFNWRMANPACLAVHKSLLHLWSLAIEDQFYLVWPILLAGLLALRVRRRWILAFVLAAVLAPAFLRAGHEPSPGAPNSVRIAMRLYFGTDARADSLFAGCFVGLLAGWRLGPKARWALTALRWAAWPAAAVVLFHFLACAQLDIATIMGRYFYFRGGFTVVAISAAVLIGALVWSPPARMSRFLEAPGLRWAGTISYGAYLWNWPIVVALSATTWPAPIARNATLLAWAGSLAAGALSHYCLETPFLRLKHRWERVQSVPAAAVPVAAAA
jgi:peptidoglycan/LPS O-acetylase OafA/YrhL